MTYRFKGFTEKANNAMNLAIASAEELGHDYVGSEHIMLGLLKEGTGVAFTVLNKLGVTAEEFEKLIQERIGTGEPTQLTPDEFTPGPSGSYKWPQWPVHSSTMPMWGPSTYSLPSLRTARATPCGSCRFWAPIQTGLFRNFPPC